MVALLLGALGSADAALAETPDAAVAGMRDGAPSRSLAAAVGELRAQQGSLSGSPPLIVPAADWNGDGSSGYLFSFAGGFVRSTGEGEACLMAPAYLPDGVTIANLFVFFYDDATGENGDYTVALRRKELASTAESEVLGSVTTEGASTEVRFLGDEEIESPVVDNSVYAYYLTTCMSPTSSEHRLYAAWIFYE